MVRRLVPTPVEPQQLTGAWRVALGETGTGREGGTSEGGGGGGGGEKTEAYARREGNDADVIRNHDDGDNEDEHQRFFSASTASSSGAAADVAALLGAAEEFARCAMHDAENVLPSLRALAWLIRSRASSLVRVRVILGAEEEDDTGNERVGSAMKALIEKFIVRFGEKVRGALAARFAARALATLGDAVVSSIGSKAVAALCALSALKLWEPSLVEKLEARRVLAVERTPALHREANQGRTSDDRASSSMPPTSAVESARPEEDSRHHWRQRPDLFNNRERFVDRLYALVMHVRGQNQFETPSATDPREGKMKSVMQQSEALVNQLLAENVHWAAEKIVGCIVAAAVWGEEDPTLQSGVDPQRLQQLSRRLAGGGVVPGSGNRSGGSSSSGSSSSNGASSSGRVRGGGRDDVAMKSRGVTPTRSRHAGTSYRRVVNDSDGRDPHVPRVVAALTQPLQTYVLILLFANDYRLSSSVSRYAIQMLEKLHRDITSSSASSSPQPPTTQFSSTSSTATSTGPGQVQRSRVALGVNVRETVLKLQALSALVAALMLLPWASERDVDGAPELLRQSSIDAAKSLFVSLKIVETLEVSMSERWLAISVPWVLGVLRCVADSNGFDALLDRDRDSVLMTLIRVRLRRSLNPANETFSTSALCVSTLIDAFLDDIGLGKEDKQRLRADSLCTETLSCNDAGTGIDDDIGQIDVAYIRSFCPAVYGVVDILEGEGDASEEDPMHRRLTGASGGGVGSTSVSPKTKKRRQRKIRAEPNTKTEDVVSRDQLLLLHELLSENPQFRDTVEFVIGAVSRSVAEKTLDVSHKRDVNGAEPFAALKASLREACSSAVTVALNALAPPAVTKEVVLAVASVATDVAFEQVLAKKRAPSSPSTSLSSPSKEKLRKEEAGEDKMNGGDTKTAPSSELAPKSSPKENQIEEEVVSSITTADNESGDDSSMAHVGERYMWAREGLLEIAQVSVDMRSNPGFTEKHLCAITTALRTLSSYRSSRHSGGGEMESVASTVAGVEIAFTSVASTLVDLCLGMNANGDPVDGVSEFSPKPAPFGTGKWLDGEMLRAAVALGSKREKENGARAHEDALRNRALLSPVACSALSLLRTPLCVVLEQLERGTAIEAFCSVLFSGLEHDIVQQTQNCSPFWLRRAIYAPAVLLVMLVDAISSNHETSILVSSSSAILDRTLQFLLATMMDAPRSKTRLALRVAVCILENLLIRVSLYTELHSACCSSALLTRALEVARELNDSRSMYCLLRISAL